MVDRPQPQLALQRPEHRFQVRQQHVRAPKPLRIPVRQVRAQAVHPRMRRNRVPGRLVLPPNCDRLLALLVRLRLDLIMRRRLRVLLPEPPDPLPDLLQPLRAPWLREPRVQLPQFLQDKQLSKLRTEKAERSMAAHVRDGRDAAAMAARSGQREQAGTHPRLRTQTRGPDAGADGDRYAAEPARPGATATIGALRVPESGDIAASGPHSGYCTAMGERSDRNPG